MKGHPYDTFEFNPVGAHTRNASLGSAVTLTPPAGATKILIQAMTNDVRFTLDSSAPSATNGFIMIADDPPLLIPLAPDVTVRVIQDAAGAEIQYQWGSGG